MLGSIPAPGIFEFALALSANLDRARLLPQSALCMCIVTVCRVSPWLPRSPENDAAGEAAEAARTSALTTDGAIATKLRWIEKANSELPVA
mmetsp:Transcript_100617/g.281943  ORF Transcript_100617/g.281943 Transcript_100617/m.281943 type:complete len:91 (+) Transcript_100617:1315-1587(+)